MPNHQYLCALQAVLCGLFGRRTDTGEKTMTPTMHAAWLVEDAVHGLPLLRHGPETLQSVRHSYLIYQEMNLLYNLTVGLLVLLTFCETPLWCLHTGTTASRPWLFLPAEVTCPAPDGGFIFLAQIPYVPVAWGCVIELLCYGVLWLWFGFGVGVRFGLGLGLGELRLGFGLGNPDPNPNPTQVCGSSARFSTMSTTGTRGAGTAHASSRSAWLRRWRPFWTPLST